MKRDDPSERIPARLINECSFCHKTGLKPGILETKHGDYGIRKWLKDMDELVLNNEGLCSECEKLLNERPGNVDSKKQ